MLGTIILLGSKSELGAGVVKTNFCSERQDHLSVTSKIPLRLYAKIVRTQVEVKTILADILLSLLILLAIHPSRVKRIYFVAS